MKNIKISIIVVELHRGVRSIGMTVQNTFPRKRAASFAFRNPGMDFVLPSDTIVLASPLEAELYPFSRHEENCVGVKSLSKSHGALRLEVQECKKKIQKLSRSCHDSNAGVLTLMGDLAVLYFNLGNYDEAEKQLNRILPILIQRHGPRSRYVVSVKKDLSEVILRRGR